MSDMPVIELEQVSFAYDGGPVLRDVTLTIGQRDFVWVVGPNGGGKTTLLKLILGLLKPTEGRVRVFGQLPARVSSRIGYMPQHFDIDRQFPIDVMGVVLLGRLGATSGIGPFSRQDKRKAEDALREVGLWEARRQAFATLSGGQQRRALIARALTGEPGLLLLDEPTANLDLAVEEELIELLQKLNERLTILMVSHDPAFVVHSVKQVVCVNRTVAIHPTSDIGEGVMTELYGRPVRLIRHDRHPERKASDG